MSVAAHVTKSFNSPDRCCIYQREYLSDRPSSVVTVIRSCSFQSNYISFISLVESRMSSTWCHIDVTRADGNSQAIKDAEEGLYNNTQGLALTNVDEKNHTCIQTFSSPTSPIHEGITPFSSVPILSLSNAPQGNQPTKAPIPKPKIKINRFIKFQLWFNTYRKFFTFVTLLNLVGIVMAALGRFHYADNHIAALVLGNLLAAILMRNELFLRFLYIIAIYGLRSVSPSSSTQKKATDERVISGLHYGLRWQWSRSCSMSEEFIQDVLFPALRKAQLILAVSDTDTTSRWLIFKVVTIIRERANQHDAVIATGIITNIFVLISVLSAFPWIRKSVLDSCNY